MAVLLTAALGLAEQPPPAITQYANLRMEMARAREHNDWQTYLANANRLVQLLNGSPNTWLNLARGEVHAGNLDKALAAVEHFVAMGQSTDQLLTSAEFAALREDPRFAAVRNQMAANTSPLSKAAGVFDIAEPGFVAEDIDYDPHRRRFVVTSIQKQKLISVDGKGVASDFVVSPDHWPMLAVKIDFRRRLVWVTEVALNGFASVPKADWGRSAILCYDLDRGRLLERIEGPADSALGDMVLLDNGDPLVSDGQGGGVYRLHRANKKLERIDDGSFISPQTAAVHPDGKHIFVPDYLRGIGILDLTTKQVRWLATEDKYALNGIDGLYFHEDSLILVQNGTSPERVIVFHLDPTLSRIISSHELERASPTLGDPTHGVVVGRDFYYIANSGWDTLSDDGTMKRDAKATPVHIMCARLD
jgi:sugar lactone lactonase YvrE